MNLPKTGHYLWIILQQAFKFGCCSFGEELKTTPQTNLDVEPHDYHIN